MGLFDLEKHFAFYGAYHSNPTNIVIHMIFVWPILFTALVLLYFTPPLFKFSSIELGDQSVLILNYGFFLTIIYALYYVGLDKKAGFLAAFLCLICWVGSSFLAHRLGYTLAWKNLALPYVLLKEKLHVWGKCCERAIPNFVYQKGYSCKSLFCLYWGLLVVLVSQLICWTGQFIGHGVFEVIKRAPALLDNLAQAFLMAPFFVLLEGLQSAFGYEPYPGFHARVKAKVDAEIKEWKDKKQNKLS
ncbi:hypothetical protein ACJIZ3_005378 [Penstemon smallii]|uniref:Uncharacterized protein n=1 Tax=Penstemon smallii TaxID=265156 RepID=A0ABD3S4R2_9LAMI